MKARDVLLKSERWVPCSYHRFPSEMLGRQHSTLKQQATETLFGVSP